MAREGLAKMMTMVSEPSFGAAVEMLKGGIEHHVEEEESELLPELKEATERSEWLAVGDAIAQGKASSRMPLLSKRKPTKRSTKRKTAASKR